MKRTMRPSPALVISLIALFVALGGTSYAAITTLPANSVGTAQLKTNAVTNTKILNGSVTAAKINPAGLTVPSATFATTAGGAAPTGTAGGALSGTYPNPTLAAAEAWHEVGATGEPAFQNGWANENPGETSAAFYKDPYGVVHLKGIIDGGTNDVIFTLPAGYRPGKNLIELVYRAGGGTGALLIYNTGEVYMGSGTSSASLDGVTFRAGE